MSGFIQENIGFVKENVSKSLNLPPVVIEEEEEEEEIPLNKKRKLLANRVATNSKRVVLKKNDPLLLNKDAISRAMSNPRNQKVLRKNNQRPGSFPSNPNRNKLPKKGVGLTPLKKQPLPSLPKKRNRQEARRRKNPVPRRRGEKNHLAIVKSEKDKSFLLLVMMFAQLCLCCISFYIISSIIGCVGFIISRKTMHKLSRKLGCYNCLLVIPTLIFQVVCVIFVVLIILLIPTLIIILIPVFIVIGIICFPCIVALIILCLPCICCALIVFAILGVVALIIGVIISCFVFVLVIIVVVILAVVGIILLIVISVVGVIILIVLGIMSLMLIVVCFPFALMFCCCGVFVLLLPAGFPLFVIVFYGFGLDSYCGLIL